MNIKLGTAEERISECEHKAIDTLQNETEKEGTEKNNPDYR